MKLDRNFFEQNTVDVARLLLGKTMIFHGTSALITETEAYRGSDDKASHGAKGKTCRNAPMFEKGGLTYVYFIYGMYHCLNFTTEKEDFPAAVLIRGIKLLNDPYILLDGPGKLCKHLGITREHNMIDITNNRNFYILDNGNKPEYMNTTRIGICKSTELQWRFIMKDFSREKDYVNTIL